jgi:hypothetical protein
MEMHAKRVNAHPNTSLRSLFFIVASFWLFSLNRLFSRVTGESTPRRQGFAVGNNLQLTGIRFAGIPIAAATVAPSLP